MIVTRRQGSNFKKTVIEQKVLNRDQTETCMNLAINKANEIEDPMDALHEIIGLASAGGTFGPITAPAIPIETAQQKLDRKLANIKTLVKDKSITDVEANEMRKELVMTH